MLSQMLSHILSPHALLHACSSNALSTYSLTRSPKCSLHKHSVAPALCCPPCPSFPHVFTPPCLHPPNAFPTPCSLSAAFPQPFRSLSTPSAAPSAAGGGHGSWAAAPDTAGLGMARTMAPWLLGGGSLLHLPRGWVLDAVGLGNGSFAAYSSGVLPVCIPSVYYVHTFWRLFLRERVFCSKTSFLHHFFTTIYFYVYYVYYVYLEDIHPRSFKEF